MSLNADYLVVGGGVAGLTLAGRLVEDNDNVSVVVLEAGPDLTNTPEIQVPGA